jgi:hypothetical protein
MLLYLQAKEALDTPVRSDVRVESFAGSFIGKPTVLGLLVSLLEVRTGTLFEGYYRLPVNLQVGP